MSHPNCLNCGTALNGKYCSNCGQKAETHRISFAHFVKHDVLHGTFHIERGMLFTARQALVRPGRAALDYIAGKRVNYYNIFYFALLLIGVNILLTHYYNAMALRFAPDRALTLQADESGKALGNILSKYGKLIILALVPLTALNSFLVFKRKKLHYSEHIIVSGVLLLGILLITTIVFLASFVEFTGLAAEIFVRGRTFSAYLVILYFLFGYWNAFRKDYTLAGFSYRMMLFALLCLADLLVILVILIGFATGWKANAEIEFLI